MITKKYLSLLIATLLIGYALGYFTVPKQKVVVVKREVIPSNRYMLPVLEIVVRDAQGNIIKKVTKIGDPPVKNFLVLFMFAFFEDNVPDQVLNKTAVDVDGISHGINVGAGAAHATVTDISDIAIGNGTNPQYSIDKYKLDNEVARFDIQTFGAFYNSTHMWILFRAQWTNPYGDLNITEVGLIWDNYNYYSSNYADFLIFYDVIDPPITVPSGGSITVSYYIYIRYG